MDSGERTTLSQMIDASDSLEIPERNQPVMYLTTDDLAVIWNDRSKLVDAYRRDHPDDVKGLEVRQNQVTAALQAYRFLSVLEQQLGYHIALPVLGPLGSPPK